MLAVESKTTSKQSSSDSLIQPAGRYGYLPVVIMLPCPRACSGGGLSSSIIEIPIQVLSRSTTTLICFVRSRS